MDVPFPTENEMYRWHNEANPFDPRYEESKQVNLYYQRFKTVKERFEQYFTKSESCWIWKAHICQDGYARFWINNKEIQAHRASWIIYKGPIPEEMIVCHSCDVRHCVNPDHLFLGSHKDNTQDMIRKQRDFRCRASRRGSNSNFVKLNASQVMEIYKSQEVQTIIAGRYGITQTAVSLIKRGINWKWLTQPQQAGQNQDI